MVVEGAGDRPEERTHVLLHRRAPGALCNKPHFSTEDVGLEGMPCLGPPCC